MKALLAPLGRLYARLRYSGARRVAAVQCLHPWWARTQCKGGNQMCLKCSAIFPC